jgi:hypothetical protein
MKTICKSILLSVIAAVCIAGDAYAKGETFRMRFGWTTFPTSCMNVEESFDPDSERFTVVCSGGDVSKYVTEGYCSPDNGIGRYNYPNLQSCPNCALSKNSTGEYCYCKLYSVNGSRVYPSDFVFQDKVIVAEFRTDACQAYCAYHCAGISIDGHLAPQFREALLEAARR